MKEIRYAAYAPQYAGSIADMWKESAVSWGGRNSNPTEESVRQEHENSTMLNVDLALDGEKVVGYCSFSYYEHDEGALYVPLLNVSPDYHGYGIGKNLIQRAVERTVSLGWPRLDLFTWPGNTKAVPMYKKCGFFWEKEENRTHLMNFIPTVLQTEALKSYFQHLSWYGDLKRELQIQPDGRAENDFEFYEYYWEKEGTALRVEFEKTGRSIRLIETDDYLIYAELDKNKLVFGRSYPVRYYIGNKSGRPLAVEIRGEDDKNVRFSMDRQIQVPDSCVIEGEFHVDAVEEELKSAKTHPRVSARCLINGEEVWLRVGIRPQFPATVRWLASAEVSYLNQVAEGRWLIENHGDETTRVEFSAPESALIDFTERTVQVSIPPGGKKILEASGWVRQFGVLTDRLQIKAKPEGLPATEFTFRLDLLLKGHTGRFGGETAKEWIIGSGLYTVHLNKENSHLLLRYPGEAARYWWLSPQLGRPYSSEWDTKQAAEVSVFAEDELMVMEIHYESEAFQTVRMTRTVKLYGTGLVEHYIQVENVGASMQEEIYINERIYASLEQAIIPYDSKFIDLRDPNDTVHQGGLNHWEMAKISENWLFGYGDTFHWGLTWNPETPLTSNDWHLSLEQSAGILEEKQIFRTRSTFLSAGGFSEWTDFRSFALGRNLNEAPDTIPPLQWIVQQGNPFVVKSGKVNITLREHRTGGLDGDLQVDSAGESISYEGVTAGEGRHTVELNPVLNAANYHPIRLALSYNAPKEVSTRHRIIFPVASKASGPEVTCRKDEGQLQISNGALAAKASPGFGNALISLQYEGEEWLESSYPTPGPKSWWNPWLGGITSLPQGISQLSMLDESRSLTFASLTDHCGNQWKGIEIRTVIERVTDREGLELAQYYLLLPGSPVLCCVNRLINGTGNAFYRYNCTTSAFISTSGSAEGQWVKGAGETTYKRGTVPINVRSRGVLEFGSDSRKSRMLVIADPARTKGGAFMNNQVLTHAVDEELRLLEEESVFTKPVFYVFTDQSLVWDELTDLGAIRFNAAN